MLQRRVKCFFATKSVIITVQSPWGWRFTVCTCKSQQRDSSSHTDECWREKTKQDGTKRKKKKEQTKTKQKITKPQAACILAWGKINLKCKACRWQHWRLASTASKLNAFQTVHILRLQKCSSIPLSDSCNWKVKYKHGKIYKTKHALSVKIAYFS